MPLPMPPPLPIPMPVPVPLPVQMLNKKRFSLDLCKYLCLDEADRMIGEPNFEEEVRPPYDGTRYVPGTWHPPPVYMAPGMYPVHGTRYMAPVTWYPLLGT